MNVLTNNINQNRDEEKLKKVLDDRLINDDKNENDYNRNFFLINNQFSEKIDSIHFGLLRNYCLENDVSESYIKLIYKNLTDDPLYQAVKINDIPNVNSIIRYILTHFLMFITTFFEIKPKLINFNPTSKITELFKKNRISELKLNILAEVSNYTLRTIFKNLNIRKFYENIYFNSSSFMIFIFNAFKNIRKLNNFHNENSLKTTISILKISILLFDLLEN